MIDAGDFNKSNKGFEGIARKFWRILREVDVLIRETRKGGLLLISVS
jgi:uncharacterized protein YjiK